MLVIAAVATMPGCEDPHAAPPSTTSPPSAVSATAVALVETATPTPTPTPTLTPTPEPTPVAWRAIEDGDWALANGGIRNTRGRTGGFDPAAGDTLVVGWEAPLTSSGPYGYAAGAPAIVDGVVYVQTLGGDVSALDLETGERLWRYDGGVQTAGPIGPAVGNGHVYVVNGGARLQSLDAATGEVLWTVLLEKDGYQPVVVGDVVLAGTGNQAHIGGNSGYLHAVRAADGASLWSFQVVEEGFWGNPELNSGGGVWAPVAVDQARGRVYVGTGNAGPYPGTRAFPNASSRPGPNLYTSSILALDIETGAVDWYFQAVPHGLFDQDFQSSPMLVDARIRGASRELVIGAGKVGQVIAFDPDTGEVAWRTAVGRHENDDLPAVPMGEAVLVYPGVFGGVESPMATDGRLVFVPVVDLPTLHTATGHGAGDGSSALLNASLSTRVSSGTGELVALDLATGRVAWRHEFDAAVFGGATVWGDHVYSATYDGQIFGLDRETGDVAWSYDTGGRINAWPALTEESMLWPVGLGPEPRVIAFRAMPPPRPTPGPEAAETPPPDARSAADSVEAGGSGQAAVAAGTPAP